MVVVLIRLVDGVRNGLWSDKTGVLSKSDQRSLHAEFDNAKTRQPYLLQVNLHDNLRREKGERTGGEERETYGGASVGATQQTGSGRNGLFMYI